MREKETPIQNLLWDMLGEVGQKNFNGMSAYQQQVALIELVNKYSLLIEATKQIGK